MKRLTALFLCAVMTASLASCGGGAAQSTASPAAPASEAAAESQKEEAAPAAESQAAAEAPAEESQAAEAQPESEGEKIYYSVDSWMYPSLNPHVDYQGWQEYGYGNIEMLFRIEPDGSIIPFLAESAEPDDEGKVWTIKVKDDVTFSDGTPLKADQVIANLEDLRDKNSRYGYLADAVFTEVDEMTVEIALSEPYYTLRNDLADPDAAIIKIGEGEDLDLAPVSTGPFVVTEFIPEQKVTLAKNTQYWNGEAQIDGAVFTLVPDQDAQTMAFQNGEASSLGSPSAEAIEICEQSPDLYDIVYAPTSRLYMYFLNFKTLDAAQRKAIIAAVTADDFVTVMNGLVEPAEGPFLSSTAFGDATAPEHGFDIAKAAMEEGGYTLNADGYYEKDGTVPVLRLCYYPARSLDKLAALMQEQLKAAGINAEIQSYEDPDAGYITTGDFEIGLYNLISAPSGDPYYFLNLTMGSGAYNAGGYENEEIAAALAELAVEKDPDKRAELAKQMVQTAIDDDAYGYLCFLVKATILQKGVKNIGEDNAYHGGLTVESVME